MSHLPAQGDERGHEGGNIAKRAFVHFTPWTLQGLGGRRCRWAVDLNGLSRGTRGLDAKILMSQAVFPKGRGLVGRRRCDGRLDYRWATRVFDVVAAYWPRVQGVRRLAAQCLAFVHLLQLPADALHKMRSMHSHQSSTPPKPRISRRLDLIGSACAPAAVVLYPVVSSLPEATYVSAQTTTHNRAQQSTMGEREPC